MAASGPTIRLGIADHDLNQPILDGTVRVEGFEIELSHGTDDGAIHALLRDGKIDACEYSFGNFMAEKGRGEERFIAIPAFPNRKFRLSYTFVNRASGISGPKDLEGKKVGIIVWQNTAGIWARGALQHHYGVDLTKISWFSAGPIPPSLPSGINVVPLNGKLEAKLLSGELDAVIQADVPPSITEKDPRVGRLFPDYKTEEQNYFRKTGIFPISHMVTLPQEFVKQHPSAPVALLQAFRRSRDEAFHRIEDQQVLSISWASALLDEQRALMGKNYWAYNVSDNRTPLESMLRFAHEQGVTPNPVSFDRLFVPEAAALPGW